uniref:YqaJ viral recombinase domain-containing protein n=1 Tax=Pogona vitticeps TaxID=103695 RepID=A0A6J0VF08_9SAUR
MGRPRKYSDNVASPRPAATAPKAASAVAQSSVSSRTAPAKTRVPSALASKSENSRRGEGEKLAYVPSPRGSAQSSQTRSATGHGGKQGDTSRGAKAKTSAAAGDFKSPASGPKATTGTSESPRQSAAKPQSKGTHFVSPISTEKVAEIERETRGQRANPEWYKWRENRITASVAPKIANSKFANGRSSEVPRSYLKAVVEPGSSVQTPAMSWGVRNEKKAIRAYEALKSSKGEKPVKVDDCGLFIDKKKAWLAASPDGVVREAGTGKDLGLLEVKCPYKHREKTVTEACKDKTFCLEKTGDSYALKKTHPYYVQVQCQMGVSGHKKADLVVFTNKETAIAPVDFDPAFWEKTVPKLEKFYTDAVVPHLEEKESAGAWAREE